MTTKWVHNLLQHRLWQVLLAYPGMLWLQVCCLSFVGTGEEQSLLIKCHASV